MMNREELTGLWQQLDRQERVRCGYLLIALLAIALVWSAFAAKCSALERTRTAREAVLKELLPLKATYAAAKNSSALLSGRMASVRVDDTPARILEEIGIKGKSLKVIPLKNEERGGGIMEESAEIRIEGITANELVNLVYRLEKGSRPVQVKKSHLKVRFDDPGRFDSSLTVSLLKPASTPGQQK